MTTPHRTLVHELRVYAHCDIGVIGNADKRVFSAAASAIERKDALLRDILARYEGKAEPIDGKGRRIGDLCREALAIGEAVIS